MTAWTDAMDAELRRLYDAGISFGESAPQITAIGGVTVSRNAVIGRAHRLGLRRGPDYTPKTRSPYRRRPASERPKPKPVAAAFIPPKFTEEPAALRCVEVVPLEIRLDDLNDAVCHYPSEDAPFTFCGHPSKEGSPYCGPHHALCHGYTPPPRRSGKRSGVKKSSFYLAFEAA